MIIQNIKDMPETEPMSGFKRKYLHSEKMTFALWSVEPNKMLAEHSHPHEQITHIQKGDFEMTIDGKKKILQEGDIIVIPSHTVHSGKSITHCEIVDIFSPYREDFK